MLFKCQGFLGAGDIRGQGQSPPCPGMGKIQAGLWGAGDQPFCRIIGAGADVGS